jgi:hypothetical protein
MSKEIQTKLLSELLDKYERSSFFRNDEQPARRIMLKMYDGGKSEFNYYDIEQSERRLAVNRVVKDLAERNLISYRWMMGEENHILAEVWLNFDSLAEIYGTLNRKSKAMAVSEVYLETSQLSEQVYSSWAKNYLQDIAETILQKRDFNSSVPKDSKERADLFKALVEMDNMSSPEITERVFSMRCFGDSKKFEKTVKSRITSILRKYLDTDDDVRDEDLLRQIGIVKYPEQFEFCGNLLIRFETGTVDYAPLRFGCSICIPDMIRGEITISPNVKRIITIENRANYIEYLSKYKSDDEIIVYHGGQYSPSKKKFFLAMSDAKPKQCVWEHWGDIDYGGFSMLRRLRREINQDISPYRMNVSELMRFSVFSAAISASYIDKLAGLLQTFELSDCRECLEYMITNRTRLEQEAMLTESAI